MKSVKKLNFYVFMFFGNTLYELVSFNLFQILLYCYRKFIIRYSFNKVKMTTNPVEETLNGVRHIRRTGKYR